MKTHIFLLVLVTLSLQAIAQPNIRPIDQLLQSEGAQSKGKQHKGILNIDARLQLTADQFINGKKRELCQDPKADLLKISVQSSKAGRQHHRYQQTWNGIPVEGQHLIAHEQHGKLTMLNGKLLEGLSLNTNPSISESAALSLILKKNKQYAWQSPEMEKDLTSSYFPQRRITHYEE